MTKTISSSLVKAKSTKTLKHIKSCGHYGY